MKKKQQCILLKKIEEDIQAIAIMQFAKSSL